MNLKYIALGVVLLALFGRSKGFQDDSQKLKKTFRNENNHKLRHDRNITVGVAGKHTVVFQKQGILKEYDPKKSWRRDSEVDLYSTKPRSGYRHKDYNSAHAIRKGKTPPKSHIENDNVEQGYTNSWSRASEVDQHPTRPRSDNGYKDKDGVHKDTASDRNFRSHNNEFQDDLVYQSPENSWKRDSEESPYTTYQYSDNLQNDKDHTQKTAYDKTQFLSRRSSIKKFKTSKSTKSSIPLPCEKQRDIYVAFIDEGFELDHPNLKDSTDSSLSYDFIYNRTNVLPVPYDPDMKYTYPDLYLESSHGTMCMGRVGSKAGHGCDEGVAPHVKLVGLKAIRFGGKLVDKKEARALSYRHDIIDVFACCYGAKENVGFFGPRNLTKIALLDGATKSKNCQGVIFVYPSGNGHFDNCNADGYANSVDTVTIATVNRKGHVRENGEICSAALAAAIGEGYNTTILNSLCSDKFAGTSAACAVTAGFVGELRVIRPCLSKRDVEHIMVKTAIPGHGQQWRKNGAGLMFNDIIGFGQLDFEKMKEAAKAWSYVPERNVCVINHPNKSYRRINGFHWNHPIELYSDACRGKHEVNYLEHVQVHIELNCDQLSQVSIQLISPAKTVSNLLSKINMTKEVEQKHRNLSWTFMSVNFWNEPAVGKWTVAVIVDNAKRKVSCEYRVKTLTLYGTVTYPYSGANQPITCQEVKNSSTLVLPSSFVQLSLLLVYIIIPPANKV